MIVCCHKIIHTELQQIMYHRNFNIALPFIRIIKR